MRSRPRFILGIFAALQYLGNFIELCIQHHNLFHLNLGTDTRRFFTDFLDGKISDPAKVQDFLYFLNWNRTDRYLCLRLEAEQLDEKMHSSVATLGHIESQIPEGRAFIYQQGIVVIVNLSFVEFQCCSGDQRTGDYFKRRTI